jgi:tRNA(Ile)-lysidine synthase
MLVLLSGGRDSVCLLHLMLERGEDVRALHMNYGLRESAAGDERLCAALCERLGVPLTVRTPRRPRRGNLMAWARDERYAAARELAAGDVIATGHTATDQVETVLYRLASSPGRRALLGMKERDGDLVRPLLSMTREQTGAYCAAHGLPYAEDPTNDSPDFARNRVRQALVPVLKAVHPAAETNVLRTLEILRDEAAVLDAVVDEVCTDDLEQLRALPPALRRLVLDRLADAPVGRRGDEILALEAGMLDLGGGVRAIVECGRVRFEPTPALGKL